MTDHFVQRIEGARIAAISKRLDQAYSYAVKSHTHLWVVTFAYHAADRLLDAFDTGTEPEFLGDADNLLMIPPVGCYVCERAYSPSLRRRRCPGEPRGVAR